MGRGLVRWMRFGNWRRRPVPPRAARPFDGRVELLSHSVQPFFLGGHLASLSLQAREVFLPRRQEIQDWLIAAVQNVDLLLRAGGKGIEREAGAALTVVLAGPPRWLRRRSLAASI